MRAALVRRGRARARRARRARVRSTPGCAHVAPWGFLWLLARARGHDSNDAT